MDVPATVIEVAGERLQLLPQRALLWPARRMLLVADAHFGKAARFRMLGVPVPAGTTADNLQVLEQLVHSHAVERIVFLGDLMHGRLSPAASTFQQFVAWRASRAQLGLELVLGNHDRHAGELPGALGVQLRVEPYDIGPFSLCHHPEVAARGYRLAGHVHPVVRLHGAGHDRVRTPCFAFASQGGLLPAFGAFTGGYAVPRRTSGRVFVIAGERVLELPGGKHPASA